jgi:hypothetical protein
MLYYNFMTNIAGPHADFGGGFVAPNRSVSADSVT